MNGSSSEDSVKQNLQDRLLDSVKQCQSHFGARQEVATEGDLRVNTLCAEWEAVLSHGMKKPKTKLRSFGSKVDTLTGVALWPLIRPFLVNEEQDRFVRLRFVNSDIGRGRAWLRAAINERTLENYLHTMLSDLTHIRTLYEPYAFLLDDERSSMLPVMAAGLNSILFSLSVDAEYLNSPLRRVEVPSIAPTLRPSITKTTPDFANRIGQDTATQVDLVVASNKKKKKKKKSPSPTLDTTNIDNILAQPTNYMILPLNVTAEYDDDLKVSQELCRDPSPASFDGVHPSDPTQFLCISPQPGEEGGSGSLNSSPSCSVHSLNSASDEATPLFVPPSDPLSAIEATNSVLLAVKEIQDPSHVTAATMSEDEMKEALKALVRSKEEVEESQQHTLQELDREKERSHHLERELQQVKEELHTTRELHTQQQAGLERENDLLREQLRKYVSIVQQQQQQQQGDDDKQLDESLPQKLSEMAEMYGELMEFNDRLHKEVATKDSLIIKLSHTLQLANIKVPVSTDLLPPEALKPAKIIEVWIPSVIKRKGRGPETHHEYQIYVKLGQDEWNVYRRYAEFYEFHRQLQKNLAEIQEFQFPPKKVIGSKANQVIEERRLKLQEYLRFVIEVCSRPNVKRKDGRINNAIVYEGISKEHFLKVLPFFNDRSKVNQVLPSPSAVTPQTPLLKSPSYSGL